MKRVVVRGTFFGLLFALAACAGEQGQGLATGLGGQGDTAPAGREESVEVENPTAGLTGPLPDGGAGRCVEQYSPQAIANRAFAFDGVITKIDSSISNRGGDSDLDLAGVTFKVGQWFSGGSGSTVTIDMPSPNGSQGLPEGGPTYGIGSRLLVSGEPRWGGEALADPVAWGCDFTRYYDRETATSWGRVLSERS